MKHFEKVKIMLVMVFILSLGVQSCNKKYFDFSGGLEETCIELDITDFGALGDGVTDDTEAVISAFDTINAHPENRYQLRFPEGTYPVNAEVSADSVKIVGEGLLIPVQGSTDVVLKINGNHNLVKGLSFNEKSFCRVLLDIHGSGNTIDSCIFDRDNPVTNTSVVYSDKFLYFSDVEGVANVVKNSKVNNGRTGIGLQGSNKILDSEISNCITGILAHASTNNTEIARNIIRDNNINHTSGADGILASRNVTKLHIHNNAISNSGEHGIYFQGDSSIIEDNEVFDNYHSGIKLASYNTNLYNHPDSVFYMGRDNVVQHNKCYNNTNAPGGTTNAGIYLQAPLINITIQGNECYGNYFGVRSTSKNNISEDDPEYEDKTTLKNLLISDNHCYNNTARSLYIEGETGIIIEDNEIGAMLTDAKSASARLDSPIIRRNIFHDVLFINRATNCIIVDNEIHELLIGANSRPGNHIIQRNLLGSSNVPVDSTNVFY